MVHFGPWLQGFQLMIFGSLTLGLYWVRMLCGTARWSKAVLLMVPGKLGEREKGEEGGVMSFKGTAPMTQFSSIRPYLLRIPLTPNSANRCNTVLWGSFQIEVVPSDLSICLYLYHFCVYKSVCICTYVYLCTLYTSCVCVCKYMKCLLWWDHFCAVCTRLWVSFFVFLLNAIVILPDGECPPSITYYWMPFLIWISNHRPLPASTISFWAYSLLTSDDLLLSWSFCFPVEYAGCIRSLLTVAFDWP